MELASAEELRPKPFSAYRRFTVRGGPAVGSRTIAAPRAGQQLCHSAEHEMARHILLRRPVRPPCNADVRARKANPPAGANDPSARCQWASRPHGSGPGVEATLSGRGRQSHTRSYRSPGRKSTQESRRFQRYPGRVISGRQLQQTLRVQPRWSFEDFPRRDLQSGSGLQNRA